MAANSFREDEEGTISVTKGEAGEKVEGLYGKEYVFRCEGSAYQISCAGSTNIHNECLPTPSSFVRQHDKHHQRVLVGH